MAPFLGKKDDQNLCVQKTEILFLRFTEPAKYVAIKGSVSNSTIIRGWFLQFTLMNLVTQKTKRNKLCRL